MTRTQLLPPALPDWARELVELYESNAASQFILHGNIADRLVLPGENGARLGDLREFLLSTLLGSFDVVLSYDLGNGIRVEKGGAIFELWPSVKDNPTLPKAPRAAIETLTHYFRYCANLSKLGGRRTRVACVVDAAQLVAPALPGALDYDLNALALLMREWAGDSLLTEHDLATFLLCENLLDLHPLLVNNPRVAQVKIPLPTQAELESAFHLLLARYPTALSTYSANVSTPAAQLAGATLASIENLLKTREHKKAPLLAEDLSTLKKQLVERECNGLIEFIESGKTLDALYGQEKIKEWLRSDIALWNQNDLDALPMGYLICGPVGTGKTYMVECLAGEAGVPVVKLKNFRDKWVGSTEGNLEKIFRLLEALGRCYVFVDEADQALGKRDAGNSDSGLSGRIYGMIAQVMSNSKNRGKIIWILASSRPDLIEVDLKRPGRVDVKIPIFPTLSEAESFGLIKALCKRRGLELDDKLGDELKSTLPKLLTPGAAEALAVKVYRAAKVHKLEPAQALRESLRDYQNPIAPETMAFQMQLAIREASDLDFVPPELRPRAEELSPTEIPHVQAQ